MATKKRTARHLKVKPEDLRLSRWDSADYLHTEQDIAEYFDAALEEGGDDPIYMLHVLGTIARARGSNSRNASTWYPRPKFSKTQSSVERGISRSMSRTASFIGSWRE